MISDLFLLEQEHQGFFLDTYNHTHFYSLTLEDSLLGGLIPKGNKDAW